MFKFASFTSAIKLRDALVFRQIWFDFILINKILIPLPVDLTVK